MGKQRIDESPVRMARRRMDDDAQGFVDDDEVFVLVDDVKGHGLGFGLGRLRSRHGDGEDLPRLDAAGRFHLRPAVAQAADAAGLDQGFEAGPGKLGQGFGQQPVQPHAGLVLGHLNSICGGGHRHGE